MFLISLPHIKLMLSLRGTHKGTWPSLPDELSHAARKDGSLSGVALWILCKSVQPRDMMSKTGCENNICVVKVSSGLFLKVVSDGIDSWWVHHWTLDCWMNKEPRMNGHTASFGKGLAASYAHKLRFLNEQPSHSKCACTRQRVMSGHTQGCDWCRTLWFR